MNPTPTPPKRCEPHARHRMRRRAGRERAFRSLSVRVESCDGPMAVRAAQTHSLPSISPSLITPSREPGCTDPVQLEVTIGIQRQQTRNTYREAARRDVAGPDHRHRNERGLTMYYQVLGGFGFRRVRKFGRVAAAVRAHLLMRPSAQDATGDPLLLPRASSPCAPRTSSALPKSAGAHAMSSGNGTLTSRG